ncbi:MAG: hypothetical protein K2Q34_01815, partial [Alphaproteobacteria bacterium]|nr:hypothetical protein [Alphaproteobacteria bacterium]
HSLFDLGLAPERIALIGKCYSTSKKTQRSLENEGIYVCPSSNNFDSYHSFDVQFQQNILNFLQKAIQQMNPHKEAKIIILDDGGELISASYKSIQKRWNLIGIEQTSSGYHKLRNLKLNLHVTNVARSYAKLEVESPMIADAQATQIITKISNFLSSIKKCLLVGNGAVGKALFEKLKNHYDIIRYDKIFERSDLYKDKLNLADYNLIIGTTGETIISQKGHSKIKKGTILISSSSSDREFEAVHIRKRIKRTNNCHQDICSDGVFLPNSGFPINFHGSQEDSVPLEKIQLTMALLFEGICQGVQTDPNQKGLVELNTIRQEKVLDLFYRLNQKLYITPPKNLPIYSALCPQAA